MSERLRLDYSGLKGSVREQEILELQEDVARCHRMLFDKNSPGGDFLGWVDLPSQIDSKVLLDIQDTAASLRQEAEALLVIGIGGSYLGARAVIEALTDSFSPSLPIYYAGHHLDGAYHRDLMKHLEGKRFAIDVISKSGTTTEPAIAFRLFRALLEKNVGRAEARRLILATTDARKGALRTLADQEGYRTFIVPDDVGGRYSVLTPVGLLPIAAAGVDVEALARGAKDFQALARETDIMKNPAAFYAAARNTLYRKGKKIEILVDSNPRLTCFGEWWKQLYGESEGKQGKGLFPAACHFTTDLHSMGQWIQEGERSIFETILRFENGSVGIQVEKDPEDLDGMNFLTGWELDEINAQAMAGTALAHGEGGVPVLSLRIPQLDAYWLGQVIYFFEFACGLSGYLLGVNPFDQPGVEAYKKNMFGLLGKPGHEKRGEELQKRMEEQGRGTIV